MTERDKVQLLHGPYISPRLKRGDRATCLLRDSTVVITGLSSGRIQWLRCRALDTHGGGSELLLAGDLVRAVKNESAAAVMHWWGVTEGVVWRWRKALDAPGLKPEGSRLLRNRLNREQGGAPKGKPAPGRPGRLQPVPNSHKRRFWTDAEVALLGTILDNEVAVRTGRTLTAIYQKRFALGIPCARIRRQGHSGRRRR
jgi:hypothetical protein